MASGYRIEQHSPRKSLTYAYRDKYKNFNYSSVPNTETFVRPQQNKLAYSYSTIWEKINYVNNYTKNKYVLTYINLKNIILH